MGVKINENKYKSILHYTAITPIPLQYSISYWATHTCARNALIKVHFLFVITCYFGDTNLADRKNFIKTPTINKSNGYQLTCLCPLRNLIVSY